MLDEATFRRHAEQALEALKQKLINAEEEGGFEAEEQNGVLNVVFESPGAKFVLTPNTPVRQIWISALSTSFKLDWSDAEEAFVLSKTGETLTPLVERLLREYLQRAPLRSTFPPPWRVHEWLGRLYEHQQKSQAAAEEYEASLKLEPKNKYAREAVKRLKKG